MQITDVSEAVQRRIPFQKIYCLHLQGSLIPAIFPAVIYLWI